MELMSVTFDDVKAQSEAEKNFIANVIAANEIQLEWMKADPSFNVDTFPEGFDVTGWITSIEEKTPEGTCEPGSEEFELFARALTLTAITTRLQIPAKYVLVDHYVSAAARALVVTNEALQKAKAELALKKAAAAGDGFNAMVSPDEDDGQELIRDCLNAALAKLDSPSQAEVDSKSQL